MQRDKDGMALPDIEADALEFIKGTSFNGNVSDAEMTDIHFAGCVLSFAISAKRIADTLVQIEMTMRGNPHAKH